MKKTITNSEYLQILGLKVLANGYNEKLYDIEKALKLIIGEDENPGHCLDMTFDPDITVYGFLKKTGIIVEG